MATVCVASSFPESMNFNKGIVQNLADGLRSVVGAENVVQATFLTIVEQVIRLRPKLVVLVGSALPSVCDYSELSRACRRVGAIFAFWTVEDPYEFDVHWKFANHADHVFSNDIWAMKFYNRADVHHLPTAAPLSMRQSLEGFSSRPLDVFFCGVGFRVRQRLIEDAMPILQKYRSQVFGNNWPARLAPVVQNRNLPPEHLSDHYAAARFVLNIGRDHSYANTTRELQGVTPGPRTFEAAMVGCVQLYYQPSSYLSEYFQPDTEIVPFTDIDELEARLDALVKSPESALEIASRAQARCSRDHTFANRALTILKTVGLSSLQIPSVSEDTRRVQIPAKNRPEGRRHSVAG